MVTNIDSEVKFFVDAIGGLRCWYVSVGGCTLPSFQLALGEKHKRERPLNNMAQSQEFREFHSEASLLVWCSWRLDSPDGPITSSDDTEEHICPGLNRVLGETVSVMSANSPAWDLRVDFSNQLTLHVFCDHVLGDPSFSTNWELRRGGKRLEVAAGSSVEIRADSYQQMMLDRQRLPMPATNWRDQ